MKKPAPLDFLLASGDYKTLKTIAAALRSFDVNLGCMNTVASARDYARRRKLDGIIVDLETDAALDLIASLRKGDSNRRVVIFACVSDRSKSKALLASGATVLLEKPLIIENITAKVEAYKPVMDRERRRYFRHEIVLPVSLKGETSQLRATMLNLSEMGMAIRSSSRLACASIVDFSFDLPLGPRISGRGEIAWANGEGVMGIGFQFLRDRGQDSLLTWLSSRASG